MEKDIFLKMIAANVATHKNTKTVAKQKFVYEISVQKAREILSLSYDCDLIKLT